MPAAVYRLQPQRGLCRHRHRVRREHARQPAAVRRVPRLAGLLQRSSAGTIRLPVGYSQAQPIDAADLPRRAPGRRRLSYGLLHGRPARHLGADHRFGRRRSAGQPCDQRAQRARRRSGDRRELQPLRGLRQRRRAGRASTRRACTPAKQSSPRSKAWRADRSAISSTRTGTPTTSAAARTSPRDSTDGRSGIGTQRRRPARPLRVHEQLEPDHQLRASSAASPAS